MMAEFIEINGDLFNIDKIQTLKYSDEKNSLGNDNGIYILEIRMEYEIGSMSKAYSSKEIRDEDFQLTRKQLMEKRHLVKGYACK